MTEEIFKPVGEEDLPKVLKVLKKDWPKHFLLYQILTILDEYKKSGMTWEHTLYLYGNYETGVYLNRLYVEEVGRRMNYFYVYTADSDLAPFTKAMWDTQLIPWKTREFYFLVTPNRFQKVIEDVCFANGAKCIVDNCNLYWFPPEKSLHNPPLPDDVYIDFLDESYGAEVDRHWEHRHPGSEVTQKENLKRNFGMGLFRKSDGKLLSHGLCNYTGGIFMLHCEPGFRGRGYASYLVRHMTNEILTRGRIPFSTVMTNNKPSEIVFRRIGFMPFAETDFIYPEEYPL